MASPNTERPVASLARLSVSLPAELLARLDAMIEERDIPNRSQMIAELIRHALAEHGEASGDGVVAGTITMTYRSDRGRVRQALAHTQAAFLKEVISSQHVFLEDDQSLEVLLVQGPAARLKQLCDELRKVRGVQQLKLATTPALLPPLHDHEEADPAPAKARSARK